MGLIVYGDFNCPFSALASHRVDQLAAARPDLPVEFRAVEHSPRIPLDGLAVVDKRRADMEDEIEEVLGFLAKDEPPLELRVPDTLPNTATMCRSFATTATPELRRDLFASVWGTAVAAASVTNEGADRQRAWEADFAAIDPADRTVPTLVLDDGTIIRGRDALARLHFSFWV